MSPRRNSNWTQTLFIILSIILVLSMVLGMIVTILPPAG